MDTSLAIKQALKRSMQNQWATILSALKVNTDTSLAIKQALNRSMQNQWVRFQLVCFNKDQITLNTVIKAESLYQLIYFRYPILT